MYCPACGHVNGPGSDACGNCLLPLAHLDDPAPHDRVERRLMTDPVSILEPRPPVTVADDADLGRAVRLMVEKTVGAVLVTAAGGGLIGVLTERDLLTKAAGLPDFESVLVRDVMTPAPETVAPTDTLAYALGKMDAGGYRHLPVVAGGRPVGMISVRDVLRYVTHICQTG